MKSADNNPENKPKQVEKSVGILQKSETEYHQSTQDRLAQLAAQLEQNAAGLTQQLEASSKKSERLINSIKEENHSQSELIIHVEKKIDYVDKTLELRIKHFDELLKAGQEQYEKKVKNLQDDMRYQIERLASIETRLSGLRYWYVGVGVIILGLIWVLMSQIGGVSNPDIAEIKKSTDRLIISQRQDTQGILRTINQQNRHLPETIKKDNQRLLTTAQQPYRQQLSVIRRENKAFLKALREDNQHFLSALQQSNQERLSELVGLLQPEAVSPPSEPTPVGEAEEGEEAEPTSEEELP